MHILSEAWYVFLLLVSSAGVHNGLDLFFKFVPFVVFLELPIYALIMLGVVRYVLRQEE